MKTGLVSISFRKKTVKELIKAAKESGLEYIEWGGDVHVPMGNVKLARKVKRLMNGAGLKCETYGSYFGVIYHCDEHFPMPFKKVLKTAKALGAKTVRVWLGWPCCGCKLGKGIYLCEKQFNKNVSVAKYLCQEAKKFGMTLSIECHFATLSDDYHDTLRFLEKVNCDNLKLYWQPNHAKSFEYNLEALKALRPYITNVHVFNWNEKGEKFPLIEGKSQWDEYFKVLNDENSGERVCFLEFMPNGELSSLPAEAASLKTILEGIEK
ncbi:MAG: sugar phosphate isomerase/epimerase [Ruminococcaceae bacterium]|nr:sugar phosphate isomerase/epimerase [Oscillospiraceae bacterium]